MGLCMLSITFTDRAGGCPSQSGQRVGPRACPKDGLAQCDLSPVYRQDCAAQEPRGFAGKHRTRSRSPAARFCTRNAHEDSLAQDNASVADNSALTDELDDLIRTRLSRPEDASALQSLLQQTMTDQGQSAGTLEFRRGVAELTVPGQFQIGLTLRAAQGPWILCWANILVREHAAPADNQQTHWISPFLRAHLQRGASLSDALTILQQFCLKLQLTILRTQAINLQRGRLSNAIAVNDSNADGGSEFTVSYWVSPAPSVSSTACKIRISLQGRNKNKALRIHHSPALVNIENSQENTPVGTRSTDFTQRILPDQVNFEKLLVATMQTRAAMRIEHVACTLSARIKAMANTASQASSSKRRLDVKIADKKDSAGFPYVDVTLPSARLELHVRRETGLLQLHQADGWRHDEVLALWQAQLDQGSGVVEDASSSTGSIATMFISTHRRLLLESIIDRACARGARVETPRFQPRGVPVGQDQAEGNVFHSADSASRSHKAFIRITAAALDYEHTYHQPQPQHQCGQVGNEQFYLALWIGENDDSDNLHACLGAFVVPSQITQDGLELSTILQLDSNARRTGSSDSPSPRSVRRSSGQKRQALSPEREDRNSKTDCDVVFVQSGCSTSIAHNDEFRYVDVLLERAASAVMAHCLRRALKYAGLQHVWTSQIQARVALPYAAIEPVTVRVLPNITMQWQCQIDLPPGPPEVMKTLCIPPGMHSSPGNSMDMLTCDGRQVCLRYGGAHTPCNVELWSLCGDGLRIMHMAELCYSVSEMVSSASSIADASSNCLNVRCLSLRQVVIECLDKAKTTITIDANLSSTQICAPAAAANYAGGNMAQPDQSESWEAVAQGMPPRLRVTFDPNPGNSLHFCACFFPPAVYRVVGYSAEFDHRVKSGARRLVANAAPSTAHSLSLPQSSTDTMSEFVDVADLRACARFLCERDKK